MNPVMYLIAESGNPMSKGKFAAQAAHAAVEAFRLSPDDNVKRMWDCGGHYAKIVLQTDNLFTANLYLTERHFAVVPIIDEGRTEFTGDLTLTFLGCCIVDKDLPHVKATFGAFKLYKDDVELLQAWHNRCEAAATLDSLGVPSDGLALEEGWHPIAKLKESYRAHRARRTARKP